MSFKNVILHVLPLGIGIYQMYQRYKIFLFIETSNSKSKLPGKRLHQVETRFKQMIWFAKYSWHDAMRLQTHFQNQHTDGRWRIYASVKLDQHLFRLWLVVCLAASHYNNSGFEMFYTKKWILIRRLQTVSSMCWHNTRLNIIDVIMSTTASQITGVSVVCSTVSSGANQRKHQSSAWLAFTGGGGGGDSPVTCVFPHKGPATLKKLPFADVIMEWKWWGMICIDSSNTAMLISESLTPTPQWKHGICKLQNLLNERPLSHNRL